MRRWTLSILVFLLLGGTALATPGSPEDAILHLEDQHRLALAAEDVGAPRRDLAGPAFVEHLSRVDLRDAEVKVYEGHTAIVTGVWEIVGTRGDNPARSVRRFTHLWVFVDGEWKLVSRHLAMEER